MNCGNVFFCVCCCLVPLGGCTPTGNYKPGDEHERAGVLIDGEVLTWSALQPRMAEAAGGEVIEELVLEKQLDRAFLKLGIAVDEAMVAAEREQLIRSLSEDRDAGEGLLESIRKRRGYGEVRFAGLLRRNAMLRELVRRDGGVVVPVGLIEQTHAMRHGTRKRVRVIVVDSMSQAVEHRRRLIDDGLTGSAFASLASRVSIDESADRGGLIEALSDEDPRVPMALRQAVRDTAVGALTPVVLMPKGWAVALVEGELAPDGRTLEETRGEIERTLSRVMEQEAMDRLARVLLADAKVTVMDRSAGWSWRNRSGGVIGR